MSGVGFREGAEIIAEQDGRCFDERELWWLAGILEGEGCFGRPTPAKPHSPYLTMASTDEDVVARAAAVLGTVYRLAVGQGTNKPLYVLRMNGSRAVWWMRKLYHNLSVRRRAQIDAALLGYETPNRRKLTAQQVREAREAYAAGTTKFRELAVRYGVSAGCVRNAVRGISWGRPEFGAGYSGQRKGARGPDRKMAVAA